MSIIIRLIYIWTSNLTNNANVKCIAAWSRYNSVSLQSKISKNYRGIWYAFQHNACRYTRYYYGQAPL